MAASLLPAAVQTHSTLSLCDTDATLTASLKHVAMLRIREGRAIHNDADAHLDCCDAKRPHIGRRAIGAALLAGLDHLRSCWQMLYPVATTEHRVSTGFAIHCACATSTCLWGHPVWRPHEGGSLKAHCAGQCAGHAKVRQLHSAISRQQHICGLEIPVHPGLTSGRCPNQ